MKLICVIDLFLQDVFDTPAAVQASELVKEDGRMEMSRLSSHPMLVDNLCFVHAWHTLVGAAPARLEYRDFRATHVCGELPAIETADTLSTYIVKTTALCVAIGTPELTRRIDALRVSLPITRDTLTGSSSSLHRALTDKLLDRFMLGDSMGRRRGVNSGDAPTMSSIIKLYSMLTDGDAVAYYVRQGEDLQRDEDIWLVNPITGTLLSRLDEARTRKIHAGTEVTCVDAMRRLLASDMHMIRRTWNRTLVVDGMVDGRLAAIDVATALNDGVCDDNSGGGEVAHILPAFTWKGRHLLRCPSVLPDYWKACVTLVSPSTAPILSVSSNTSSNIVLSWGGNPDPTTLVALKALGAVFSRVIHVITGNDEEVLSPAVIRMAHDQPWIYVLAAGQPGWTRDLFGAMLRRHLAKPQCPLRTRRPQDAVLLYEQTLLLVSRCPRRMYEEGRNVRETEMNKENERNTNDDDAVHTVGMTPVVIESRLHPASTILALHLTVMNLDTVPRRRVVVFCNRANREYFRTSIAASVVLSNTSIDVVLDDTLPPLNAPGPFDVERVYNGLLKGRSVWAALRALDVRIALMVQDDGVVLRPGLDRDVRFARQQHVYIGAPWPNVPGIFDAMKANGNLHLVGNGGVSLRDVDAMLRIVDDPSLAREGRRIHDDHVQIVPEDVHFGWAATVVATALNIPPCHRDVAAAFAAEMVVPDVDMPAPFALHKPWPYWSVDDTCAVLARYLPGHVTVVP